MNKVSLLPADTYIVINRTLLNDQDRKLLIMLYQPIVSANAINLYFTLWSYLDKSEILSNVWTHHQLMNSMSITITELIEAREKLEGIGLLKTYIKKDNINNYVYELYSPLPAHEFFDNPILSTVLYTNIGSNEFDQIKEYFQVPKIKLTEYENITLSFTDVYESGALMTHSNNNIKKRTTQKLNIQSKIDLDSILSNIPEEILVHKNINKEIKELLCKLIFIYDLNDDELTNIIRNSINEKHNLDNELLRNNTRKFYQFEHSGKLPSIIYKNQPEYLRKPISDTSIRSKVIYQFENMSPYDFLSSKYKDAPLSKSDTNILEYILVDMNMNPGVANVLIDYVLKINNNKLVRPFIESICGQWKRNNIITVEDAMTIAEKEYKNKKNITKPTKKIEAKPEWFDQEIKTSNKNQELEQILKEFR